MTFRSEIYNFAAQLASECSAAYEDYLYAAYERAEIATNGRMVNRRGIARGVDSWELFSGLGRKKKAEAYASEELRDHWSQFPLLAKEKFEAQWLPGRVALMEPEPVLQAVS